MELLSLLFCLIVTFRSENGSAITMFGCLIVKSISCLVFLSSAKVARLTLGELSQEMDDVVSMKIEDNVISFSRTSDDPAVRSKHGLYRSLMNNMIIGVSEGFKKEIKFFENNP